MSQDHAIIPQPGLQSETQSQTNKQTAITTTTTKTKKQESVAYTQGNKKQTIEIVPEEIQMFYVLQ